MLFILTIPHIKILITLKKEWFLGSTATDPIGKGEYLRVFCCLHCSKLFSISKSARKKFNYL
jgi:hypothetical protein